MWRETRDVDFRDERQSRVYPRLSGWGDETPQNPATSDEWVIPDLSNLTDEEFQRRLETMKREHNLTLDLCDKLGLRESVEIEECQSTKLPIATIDRDYTLSTEQYTRGTGVETSSPHFAIKNFKASKPPATTRNKTLPKNTKESKPCRANKMKPMDDKVFYGSDDMLQYKIQKYLDDDTEYESKEMFDSCSIDECMLPKSCHRSRSLAEFHGCQNGNDKGWKHQITIPKLFNMTIRDENKALMVSRSMSDLAKERLNKTIQEEKECKKNFRASPLPANIYLPLYDEIKKKKEFIKQMNIKERMEFLQRDQKPFLFDEREKRKQIERYQKMKSLYEMDAKKPDAEFKAQPFPNHIYDENSDRKLENEEELRKLKAFMRADKMLKSSYLPENMTKKRPKHVCQLTSDDICCNREGGTGCEKAEGNIIKNSGSQKKQFAKEKQYVEDESYKENRWPRTCLSANPLSRSLADYVHASSKTGQAMVSTQQQILSGNQQRNSSRNSKSVKFEETSHNQMWSQDGRRYGPRGILCNSDREDEMMEEQMRREIEAELEEIDA